MDRQHARARRLLPAVLTLVVFLLNAYIARDLFSAEFTWNVGSIESAFISFERYIMANWGDLTWYPVWYGGMPFHNVYQPALHVTVAAAGTLLHLTPQHAYHLITALTYCFGPVALFWFCARLTGSVGYGFAVAVMYSLVSPGSLLEGKWLDTFHPRRFETLVMWGEGPHITALTLLPVVLWCLYLASVKRKPWFLPIASVMLAALVLTNWPGTIGLTLAILAFCVSELGEGRMAWARLAFVAVVAYLLAGRWDPPSAILLVPQNLQKMQAQPSGAFSLLAFGGAMLVLLAIQLTFRKRIGTWLRFAIYFSFLTGLVTLVHTYGHADIIPQSGRFLVEMEMALVITACWLVKLALDRVPRKGRWAVVALLLIAAIPAVKSNRRFARWLTAPVNMTATSEYKVAQAFARLRPHQRVFAPANISFWMNLWTETPQVSGCCDQDIPDNTHRMSDWVIYTGQNAGERDAAISEIWLRAFGATAIATNGPRSTEPYKAYWHPFKFEGLLPVLWRDGDDIIYEIPDARPSLAHVVPTAATVARAPENGLDTAPLEPYVRALQDPREPAAEFTWTSRHSARIAASVHPGEVLAVQISYHKGWHAKAGGVSRPILRDKLGQMVIEPGCHGACAVELLYDGGLEARIMAALQVIGILLAAAAPFALSRRRAVDARS